MDGLAVSGGDGRDGFASNDIINPTKWTVAITLMRLNYGTS